MLLMQRQTLHPSLETPTYLTVRKRPIYLTVSKAILPATGKLATLGL